MLQVTDDVDEAVGSDGARPREDREEHLMMWFFAVLVVLAMGGIAVVAPGAGRRWRRCTTTHPTPWCRRTDPSRAEDLRRMRFSLAFRGYRMSRSMRCSTGWRREGGPETERRADATSAPSVTSGAPRPPNDALTSTIEADCCA